METTTIKITTPEGFQAKFDEAAQHLTIVPVPKNIRERIQGWADILAIHNTTQEQFDQSCQGLRPHETANREVEMITEAYNEGKKVDFSDGTVKRLPVFDASGGGFRSTAPVAGTRTRLPGPAFILLGLMPTKTALMQ